ncbi:MAG: nucleotidyltransferase domain-containing protein [Candidatus Gottesmanbacteria bacterium]|nr:nucleotidyltransferase domain-containing protein [Candidatus Gottesmanbacteria bacterium]
MSKADVTILLKKYLALISHKYPVQSAYLFGSFARGFIHDGSDIDVCIISPAFGKDYFDEEMDLRLETLKVDSRIEPVAFNPADFDDKYNLLVHEVKTHGIQIL